MMWIAYVFYRLGDIALLYLALFTLAQKWGLLKDSDVHFGASSGD